MEIINNPTHDEIKKAAKALKDGHLVAFPTETVYGLGADATNEKAISRIYSVKGRPTDHPLIVHISSINQLDKWAIDIPDYAIKLAKEFWPGPMTLILKRSDLAKDFITGGQECVGLRVPDQPVALALLSEFEKLGGVGVAAPSANRFGAVSPTTANSVKEELEEYLESKDLILDDGQCNLGIESTIIDCTIDKPEILRYGFVTEELIYTTTSMYMRSFSRSNNLKVSGMFKNHYSPKAQIQINGLVQPGDGFIALYNISTPKGVIRISAPRNLLEFGKNLYESFRKADKLNLRKIVILINDDDGISKAIFDRCKKASGR
jgi:L-threonylcarbamoyladenylate synthase